MVSDPNPLLTTLRAIVAERYEKDTSPLLLSDLGLMLRQRGLWPRQEHTGKTLRQIIEDAHDPNLLIVRDKNLPAYVAVATEATKTVVEQLMARRVQRTSSVPNLEALPRSVLFAFCVRQEAGKPVFLSKTPPFKYTLAPPDEADRDQFFVIDERYRRPGLKILEPSELSASDRLDLQGRITSWSRDHDVPLEEFYIIKEKKRVNALERLLAAQSREVAPKIVIPGDIALILMQHE
jgi:hypothetical protein